MKIAAFTDGRSARRIGKVVEDSVIDVTAVFPTIAAAMAAPKGSLEAADGPRVALSGVKLLAPVDPSAVLLCVGLNYHSHIQETVFKTVPKSPMIFYKPPTAVVGPNDPVRLPTISQQVDFEAELAVVIGKTGYSVPEPEAMSLVAGYTIANDVSARDLQFVTFRDTPVFDWFSGKGHDTFLPVGPWICLRDEMENEADMGIKLWLNDRLMQNGTSSDMVFSIPQLLAYITQRITLRPGDIIATGTPAGIGKYQGIFLKPGDRMRIEVEGIGRLENPVAAY